jgi:hypothetical protein
MRLINTTSLTLREFFASEDIPAYSILSHCWGAPAEEITYSDLSRQTHNTNSFGWTKIVQCCRLARERDLHWAWVDTCCIDKSSSAELTEAINSMFRWYKDATVCFAFLTDVNATAESAQFVLNGSTSFSLGTENEEPMWQALKRSRYFTRGWTLQELIAPKDVEFFNADYAFISTKQKIARLLASITGIHPTFLTGTAQIGEASVAARMSWAAGRTTSRMEDIAYSLLGIFDVNMPLIYGEGHKAFFRLQNAIMQSSDDETIFAWDCNVVNPYTQGLLARTPAQFKDSQDCIDIQRMSSAREKGFELTNTGVRYWYPMNWTGYRYTAAYRMLFARAGQYEPAPAIRQMPVRQIPLACMDVARGEYLMLHVVRDGNRWRRIGVTGYRRNTIEVLGNKIATLLFPYWRIYIDAADPKPGATVFPRRTTTKFTSSTIIRLQFTLLISMFAFALLMLAQRGDVMLCFGLLHWAIEISTVEMRFGLPLIWILVGLPLAIINRSFSEE